MAEDNTAKTDLWLDRETGKVVKSQPARGTLIARKGSKIQVGAQVRLDALDADPDADPVPAHEALGNPVEAATEDSGQVETAVTTDSVKPAAKRAAKRKS